MGGGNSKKLILKENNIVEAIAPARLLKVSRNMDEGSVKDKAQVDEDSGSLDTVTPGNKENENNTHREAEGAFRSSDSDPSSQQRHGSQSEKHCEEYHTNDQLNNGFIKSKTGQTDNATNENKMEQSNLAKNALHVDDSASSGNSENVIKPENSPRDNQKDQTNTPATNSSINNVGNYEFATDKNDNPKEIAKKPCENLSEKNTTDTNDIPKEIAEKPCENLSEKNATDTSDIPKENVERCCENSSEKNVADINGNQKENVEKPCEQLSEKNVTDTNDIPKENIEEPCENLSEKNEIDDSADDNDNDVKSDAKVAAKVEETENKTSEHCLSDNLKFYRGEIASKPFPGERITEILKWKGDYRKLEYTHSYIQWLFPISEGRGMNYSAQALQEHESKAISEDDELRGRVLEAYKMMLDFYGMELEDENTGKVKRGDNWEERYEHLNKSIHNHFRITRILKALGELGLEHLQTPWLKFIMEEATVNKALPKLRGGSMDHWIGAIKDHDEQMTFYKFLSDLNDRMNKPEADDNKEEERSEIIHNNDLGNEMINAKPENNDGLIGNVAMDQSDIKDLNNPTAAEEEVDKNTSNVDSNIGGRNDTPTTRKEDGFTCDVAIEQANEHNTGSDSKIQPTNKLEQVSDTNEHKDDATKTKENENKGAFSEEKNDTNNPCLLGEGEAGHSNGAELSDKANDKMVNEENDKNVGDTMNPDQTHYMTNDASSVEKKHNNSSITSGIEEDETKRVDDVSNHHCLDGEKKTMDTKSSHEENIPIQPGSQEMRRTAKGSLDNGTCDSGHDFPFMDEVQ